jgi:imidazole glycerol-phosphate synthase subunit HisF
MRPRVIPCLLLRGRVLVKGVRFRDHKYVGDPINALRIFNTKEVDEIVFQDISATAENRIPDIEHISQIADESYMPFAVGGGVKTIEDARKLLGAGAEKVIINTSAFENPTIIREMSRTFGSQSVVVSIDARKTSYGSYEVVIRSGAKGVGKDPVAFAAEMESMGAGEIIITSVDQEGSMGGYDLTLTKIVSEAVSIPVIASGGAGKLQDMRAAVLEAGASAAAAGSLFVFHGRRRAVLINFPTKEELIETFGED